MAKVEAMDPAQVFMNEVMSRNKSMDAATERGDSAVQQFFCGAAVLVTGGSGFLGKQLIEKLLRATKISKVFVLLRPKKGKHINPRLHEMLQDPVYDIIRVQQPDFADKIIPVAGDVAELRLGLSDQDWNTLADQVHIIFHLAATTRFDEPLRVATMVNLRGSREALKLGKACTNLKSYVHVSTAFSHACDYRINAEVLEDFYDVPLEPETMIKLAESVDEWRLNEMSPGLIKTWPNTYTFTKAVSEEMVRSVSDELPICIVRPAIVICTKQEPQPGWVDMSCLYGASGIVTGCGLGLIQAILTNEDIDISLTPVDYVNNAIIAAAYETARRTVAGEKTPKIYTVSTARNPRLWGKLQHTIQTEVKYNYPSPKAVWSSFLLWSKDPWLFWLYSWIIHMIPAYIADGVCLLLRKDRRFVKLFSKIQRMVLKVSYFNINAWKFVDNNTANLYDSLSSVDREIFNFDITKIDWREYVITWCLGLRKYVAKDGLKGTENAKRKLLVFRILTYIILPLYFSSLLFILFSCIKFCIFSFTYFKLLLLK